MVGLLPDKPTKNFVLEQHYSTSGHRRTVRLILQPQLRERVVAATCHPSGRRPVSSGVAWCQRFSFAVSGALPGQMSDSAAGTAALMDLILTRSESLGIDHPDTLLARRHLALWHGETVTPAPQHLTWSPCSSTSVASTAQQIPKRSPPGIHLLTGRAKSIDRSQP